jgi:serpin B
MYLINALYFKAAWTIPFDKAKTADEAFYNQDGTVPLIPTMNNELELYCFKGDNYTLAELPYGNEVFSTIFLLPDEGVSLSSIVENLDAQTSLNVWMERKKIPIKIPRFKIEYERGLKKDLQEMGMQSMFGPADFSLINPDADLSVSMVLQKTFAEINEEGTEAAAITIISMISSSMDTPTPRPEIKDFYVDRPFLYFIKERSTGTIIFIGEMRNMDTE